MADAICSPTANQYPLDIAALALAADALWDAAEAMAVYCRARPVTYDVEHYTAVANLILAIDGADVALGRLLDVLPRAS